MILSSINSSHHQPTLLCLSNMPLLKQTSYLIALMHPDDNYDDGVTYMLHCISVCHGFRENMDFMKLRVLEILPDYLIIELNILYCPNSLNILSRMLVPSYSDTISIYSRSHQK